MRFEDNGQRKRPEIRFFIHLLDPSRMNFFLVLISPPNIEEISMVSFIHSSKVFSLNRPLVPHLITGIAAGYFFLSQGDLPLEQPSGPAGTKIFSLEATESLLGTKLCREKDISSGCCPAFVK